MGLPSYITRERLMAAGEIHTTTTRTGQIDSLIASASKTIEDRFKRHFYPLIETVTWIGPRREGSGFWLGRDLLEITAATVDGTPVADVSDIEVFPVDHGPPFSWVGLSGREITITGVWGYSDDEAPAGALAGNINDTQSDVQVTNSSRVGVGDLIRVDTERIIVAGRRLGDTTVDLASALSADASDAVVAVTDGAGIHPGEVVTVGGERILVLDVAGDDLITKRAWDGSVLGAHSTGADIHAPRLLDTERGAAGTTAVIHTQDDPVWRNIPPAPIQTLCVAEAISSLHQETSGYGRVIGSGDAVVEATGKGLGDIRREAEPYRRMRMAAV